MNVADAAGTAMVKIQPSRGPIQRGSVMFKRMKWLIELAAAARSL